MDGWLLVVRSFFFREWMDGLVDGFIDWYVVVPTRDYDRRSAASSRVGSIKTTTTTATTATTTTTA